eukprot:Gb_29728 [translate_table: standard]
MGGHLRVCFGSSMGRKDETTSERSGKFFMNKYGSKSSISSSSSGTLDSWPASSLHSNDLVCCIARNKDAPSEFNKPSSTNSESCLCSFDALSSAIGHSMQL